MQIELDGKLITLPTPLNSHILVKVEVDLDKVSSVLEIPEETKIRQRASATCGTILQMDSGCFAAERFKYVYGDASSTKLKIGDKIMFKYAAGVAVADTYCQYQMIDDQSVIGVYDE